MLSPPSHIIVLQILLCTSGSILSAAAYTALGSFMRFFPLQVTGGLSRVNKALVYFMVLRMCLDSAETCTNIYIFFSPLIWY